MFFFNTKKIWLMLLMLCGRRVGKHTSSKTFVFGRRAATFHHKWQELTVYWWPYIWNVTPLTISRRSRDVGIFDYAYFHKQPAISLPPPLSLSSSLSPSFYLSIYLFVYLSIYSSIYLFVYLCTIRLSIYLPYNY